MAATIVPGRELGEGPVSPPDSGAGSGSGSSGDFGTPEVDVSFAQTHRVMLTIGGIDYWVPLELIVYNLELREDGTYELREDGSFEIRE